MEELGAQADVIVTITSAFAPSLLDAHVKPGTHISCMGTDTKGKQEIESSIAKRAKLYTDEIPQSISIGEFQHPVEAGFVSPDDITVIGKVINDKTHGRQSDDEITVFDGTGVGLQDLAVASFVVEKAIKSNVAVDVDF